MLGHRHHDQPPWVLSALFAATLAACGSETSPVTATTGAGGDSAVTSSSGGGGATTAAAGGAATGGTGGTPGTTTGSGGDAPVLRIMTYNIKHGEVSSLEAIADVINAEAPDLVGLQEVDVNTERSGFVDQAHRLSQLTGMASLFRSALTFPDGGFYGVALLSRFPILSSSKLLLTSGSEQRILATVDVALEPSQTVPIGITHMGLTAGERLIQAQEITAELGRFPNAILMGDINERLDQPAGQTLLVPFTDGWMGPGDGLTSPATTPNKRIDVILLGDGWPAATLSTVPDTTASDHRPVVIEVPRP